MKYYLMALGVACCATVQAAEFLGQTPTGQWLFDYQGVKMVCARTGETNVACLTETGQWLKCDYRDPEGGYFVDCRPGDPPNTTPT